MPTTLKLTRLAGALRGPAAVVLPVILAALVAGCGPAVVGRGMSCKALDEVPAALERENFSGTVLVVRRGQVLLERGFGQADRERQVPNGPETVYPIGSLTKLITATGIVKLSDERRLKLDDSLGLWLPDAPRLASLTLRQLLNHTSGLPDFSEAEVLRYQAAYPSSDSLVRVANSLKPGAKPGKSFAYSSWGYVLLGAVMERATGEPPADYLREAVLVPAGMTHTGFDARAYENPGTAVGYDTRFERVPYFSLALAGTAGGWSATCRDIRALLEGLEKRTLVSAAGYDEMHRPALEKYGFGLTIDRRRGHRVYWHDGHVTGYSSFLAEFPDERLTIVVLSNQERGVGPVVASIARVALADTTRVTAP